MTDLKELQEIAEKYGFKDLLQFADWVEDNDLGKTLFGKDQEEIENGKEEIDKDTLHYKSTNLALEILSLPEIKKKDPEKISFDQWLKLARKVKTKRNIMNK